MKSFRDIQDDVRAGVDDLRRRGANLVNGAEQLRERHERRIERSEALRRRMFRPLPLLAVFAGVPILANVAAVIHGDALAYLMEPDFVREAGRRVEESGWLLAAQILPFPLVTLIIAPYVYPLFGAAHKTGTALETARRRLLNAPLIVGATSIVGWFIGYCTAMVGHLLTSPSPDLPYLAFNFVWNVLVTGGLTFVISFYLLEFFSQRLFVPALFPERRLWDVAGVLRLSVLSRFFIFYYAVGVYPAIGMLMIVLRLNNDGQNAVGSDVFPDAAGFFLVMGALAAALTWIVARSYHSPLVQMAETTRRIRAFEYDIEAPVRSRDELGYLGESINEMAAALEEKDLIQDAFGRMVEPAVRDYLMSGNLRLGGETLEATVLFSDIRGFTGLSESLSPEEVVQLLNRYFERMSACIRAEKGLVNKFIGDAVMALFGAPAPLEAHPAAAVRAALAMRRAREELNAELEAEGRPRIRSGIGLHTGPVLSGNIGSAERMEYTVIGDAVNQASRIEGVTKKLNYDLIISGSVRERLADAPDLQPDQRLGRFRVKGKTQAIELFGYM